MVVAAEKPGQTTYEPPMAEEVKVALLEQKLEDLKDIIVKLDDAIEKMSEVNSNVGRMLAVHE